MKSVHTLMFGIVKRRELPCKHGQSVYMKRVVKCPFSVWEELEKLSLSSVMGDWDEALSRVMGS